MSRAGFEPEIYDSLPLEFAFAHKPTQPPRPDVNNCYWFIISNLVQEENVLVVGSIRDVFRTK